MPRYLTKSRFTLALGCPTRLYYTGKPEYVDQSLDDGLLAALAEGGHQVGALARLMYPGSMVAEMDHDRALAQTAALLAQDEVTIHEAALAAGDLFVRVDLLRKRKDVIELVEVKAKSYDARSDGELRGKRGNISGEFLPYVQDIAFQRHVAALALPGVALRSFLLLPDKSRAATVAGLNGRFTVRREGRQVAVAIEAGTDGTSLGEPLLALVPVDQAIEEVMRASYDIGGAALSFAEATRMLADAYVQDRRIRTLPGPQCVGCPFKADGLPVPGERRSGFHECWSGAFGWTAADFAAGSVLDLWKFRGKADLLARGVRRLAEVRPADLGLPEQVPTPAPAGLVDAQRQWYQISRQWPGGGAFFLDRLGLAGEMTAWKWPPHFIDFETCTAPIPFLRGQHPYETVAFQFSHHVMHEDGRVAHTSQFLLTDPGADPTLPFLRALQAALAKDDGSVFRWAAHENTVLGQLRKRLIDPPGAPADRDALLAFVDALTVRTKERHSGRRAMIDLADVAKRRFFHPATRGSVSIKRVLPAVMQSSMALRAIYGPPNYGTAGMPSLNWHTPVAWWVPRDGAVMDPYKLLPPVFEGLAPGEMEKLEEASDAGIAQGGAAMAAYVRLQSPSLPARERTAIRAALLRYCELDTLAMVMVVQAWQEWIGDPEATRGIG